MATFPSILRAIYPEFSLPGQIVGVPSWMESERFDIEARAEGDASRDSVLLMARRLMAERFNLEAHVEPRQVDVYALVRARRDGTLGPGLREAVECQTSDGSHGLFAPAEPKVGERPHCRLMSTTQNGMQRLSAGGSPVSSLIFTLQMMLLDRPVLDRTNLDGTFAIELEFAPSTVLRAAAPDTVGPIAGPSIFAAVTEQLGLRLESRKETLDVLVIDDVDMPTPN